MSTDGRLFCWDHWKAIPASLRATIIFLRQNRHSKEGLEEALQNALAQIAEPRPRRGLDPEYAWPFREEQRG